LEVIDQILEPDLCPSTTHANGSKELAAHRRPLVAKHLFDANPCPRSTPIPLFLLNCQRLGSVAFFLNVGGEVLALE
jgi:hypothetical protein